MKIKLDIPQPVPASPVKIDITVAHNGMIFCVTRPNEELQFRVDQKFAMEIRDSLSTAISAMIRRK